MITPDLRHGPFAIEVLVPMPEIEIITSGGVTLENARSFLDAGAAAISMGSAIVQADAAQRRSFIAGLAGAPSPR